MKREWKKKGRRSNMRKIPNIAHFGHILKKINTFNFGRMVTSLVHVRFTPSEGPQVFKNAFYINWTWKCDHEKKALLT